MLISFYVFLKIWDWKLNSKIEFFVPSTGHQNCIGKSLGGWGLMGVNVGELGGWRWTGVGALFNHSRAKHRFGTAAYMYDQSQIIHQEIYAKCLQVEKIPGVITVNMVKPKKCLKNKLFVLLMFMVLWRPRRF